MNYKLVLLEPQAVLKQTVQADIGLFGLVLSRESGEVAHYLLAALRFPEDGVYVLAVAGIFLDGLVAQEQLAETHDPGKRVVQLVGHAGDGLTEGIQLVGLEELQFQHFLFFGRVPGLGYVPGNDYHLLDFAVGGLDRYALGLYIPDAPVPEEKAVLGALARPGAHRIEENFLYPLPVLGVDVLERVLAGHFPRVAQKAVVGSAVKPAPAGVHQGYHVGQVFRYKAEIFIGFPSAAAAFCLFHRSFGSVS
ncbi:MAG: hypothetical protein A3I76_01245 [Elusimicrobia bacterium RIFCSPLOWO2_02_FULL_61_11]|nr:MAG: hypothetical protein A3I76_01245 [Elusimicrobia bacterium RIFCSPLOWO2_02_FULL_61_11]